MLEHHFWENFRKWIPHPEVDEVYDVEEIGFQEDGFVVLLRPDHFQEEKRSERALRLVWDRIVSYTVTDESYRPELWVSEKMPDWALWAFFALVIESVVFFALSNWNTGDRREPTILITRQGMRQIRAARRAKRKRRVKRGK